MPKFQFFYDYECPFCKKGWEAMTDLLPDYPGMEIEWRPVEAHPRPENFGPTRTFVSRLFTLPKNLALT